MKKTIAFIALIITCTLFGILRSDGDTLVYTVNIPTAPNSWTNAVNLLKFPASRGQLTEVKIASEWNNHRSADFYSFLTVDNPCTLTYYSSLNLLWPDGTITGGVTNIDTSSSIIGIMGATLHTESINASFFNKFSCQNFPPSKASWVGTGSLPFKAVFISYFVVNMPDFDDIFASFLTEESMSVTITYTYTPGLSGTAFPCH